MFKQASEFKINTQFPIPYTDRGVERLRQHYSCVELKPAEWTKHQGHFIFSWNILMNWIVVKVMIPYKKSIPIRKELDVDKKKLGS